MVVPTTDLVPLKEKFFNDLTSVIKRMDDISREYVHLDTTHELEDLKKRFNAELQYMATLYAKTKVYKSSNHTYMEDVIRRVKSETIKLLMDDGVKITAAELFYSSQPYFTDRMATILKLKSFFIKVEEMYDRYNNTLQCIIQSISVASKEMQNSKMA